MKPGPVSMSEAERAARAIELQEKCSIFVPAWAHIPEGSAVLANVDTRESDFPLEGTEPERARVWLSAYLEHQADEQRSPTCAEALRWAATRVLLRPPPGTFWVVAIVGSRIEIVPTAVIVDAPKLRRFGEVGGTA